MIFLHLQSIYLHIFAYIFHIYCIFQHMLHINITIFAAHNANNVHIFWHKLHISAYFSIYLHICILKYMDIMFICLQCLMTLSTMNLTLEAWLARPCCARRPAARGGGGGGGGARTGTDPPRPARLHSRAAADANVCICQQSLQL